MRKYVNVTFLIASIVTLFLVVAKLDVLPAIGDVNSAPALHVSKYYIEHAVHDTNSVSYTHLDVYKRQALSLSCVTTVNVSYAAVASVHVTISRA